MPILLATLGTCVFILRQTSLEMRDKKRPSIHFPAALLRICVGTVAGILIGWFAVKPEGPTLTPYALAFLAGYGIDIVFAVLDRFTSTFSDRPKADDRPRAEEPVSTPPAATAATGRR